MCSLNGAVRFQFPRALSIFPAVFLVLLTSAAAHASLLMPDLGIAGRFNAFILGDMQGYHSDVEGRLAVGGDLKLENYSIGLQLPNSGGTRDDLVVGGNAEFENGRMYSGNAVVGGDSRIGETVGFYNGDNPDDASGSARGGPVPLGFSGIGDELKSKSEAWGAWDAKGVVTRDDFGNIEFKGEGRKAVFNVGSGGLAGANSFLFDMPHYTTAVINVFDQDVTLSALGFHHTAIARFGKEGQVRGDHNKMPDNQPGVFRHNGALTNRILFNFVNATSLNMNAIGFKGSVLAPKANVQFFNGHIDGNLIAGSLSAPDLSGLTLDQIRADGREQLLSGQINNYRFMDVPAPSTLSAFALGLLLLGLQGWRGRLAQERVQLA